MVLIRISIFFIVMWSFSVFSLAAEPTYFDFVPASTILSKENVLTGQLKYKLSGVLEKDFILRPVVSEGRASILNMRTNSWVDSSDLWNKMPLLSKDVKIKIEGLGNLPANVYFIIQNTKDFQLFYTLPKKIWSHENYKNYVEALNENILSNQTSESSPEVIQAPIVIPPQAPKSTQDHHFYALTGIVLTFVVLLVLLGKKLRKMLK